VSQVEAYLSSPQVGSSTLPQMRKVPISAETFGLCLYSHPPWSGTCPFKAQESHAVMPSGKHLPVRQMKCSLGVLASTVAIVE